MAAMLQAVRNAGALNIAILGGLAGAQDFSKWVTSVRAKTVQRLTFVPTEEERSNLTHVVRDAAS